MTKRAGVDLSVLEEFKIVEQHEDGNDDIGNHAHKNDQVKNRPVTLVSLLCVHNSLVCWILMSSTSIF